MSVNLAWVNRATGADEQRIYRSTSPFDGDSLPSILATIDAGATSYSDTTTAADTEYFYRIGAVMTGSPDVVKVSGIARVRTAVDVGYLTDGSVSGNNISDGAGNQITWG